MRRKEVIRRLTSVAEVRAAQHAHRELVGDKLDRRPAARSTGAFSGPYLEFLDGELAAIESGLITAEDAHVRHLIRTVELRRRSKEDVAALYDKQISARQVLSGLYGAQRGFELAAVSGETPRHHQALAEQVDQTVKLLRDPAAAEPAVKIAGITVDAVVVADDLEAGRGRLLASRRGLQRTLKASDGTRARVNAAIREFDQVFPWVAGSLENAFRLAGEHELADRIRTSRRRVTRRQAAGEGESEAGEAPPGASQASGAVESAAPPADS